MTHNYVFRLLILVIIILGGTRPQATAKDLESNQSKTPIENQEGSPRPGPASAEKLARSLINAINQDKVDIAWPLFFPEEPFLRLKDMPRAMEYYRGNLVPSYKKDIEAIRLKINRRGSLMLDQFQFGMCKWKANGAEYNKIPYWSCYKSRILARDNAAKKITIKVKTLINWGQNWFITHLGNLVE